MIERLREDYEAEGYSFYMYPPRDILPQFVGDYQPDALAIRNDDHVIFEIIDRQSRGREKELSQIANATKQHEGWSFVIVYTPDDRSDEDRPIGAAQAEALLRDVEALIDHGHTKAALLIAWSALEAAAREASPGLKGEDGTAWPVPSRQLTDYLVSIGWVSQLERERVKRLATIRNFVAHGLQAPEVFKPDLDFLVGLVVRNWGAGNKNAALTPAPS